MYCGRIGMTLATDVMIPRGSSRTISTVRASTLFTAETFVRYDEYVCEERDFIMVNVKTTSSAVTGWPWSDGFAGFVKYALSTRRKVHVLLSGATLQSYARSPTRL